jgi:hypothetical protein
MFKARYFNRTTFGEYFRTIWADSEPEANKIAKRYARKGYRLITLTGGFSL